MSAAATYRGDAVREGLTENWNQIMNVPAILALAGAVIACALPEAAADDRQVIGLVEHVRIYPGGHRFKAKVDTGARTSSINAQSIERFQHDGHPWVRFSLVNCAGTLVTFERPVVRVSKVHRAGVDVDARPVVNLGICLGKRLREAEVSITDRTGMNYCMLIGRKFLGDRYLIDPSATFLTKPDCPSAAPK